MLEGLVRFILRHGRKMSQRAALDLALEMLGTNSAAHGADCEARMRLLH